MFFHLPVRGSGDGGWIYSTVADFSSFWRALFSGRIVPAEAVAELVRPRSEVPEGPRRYGLGFWLHPSSDVVILEGSDAGVSFRRRSRPDAERHAHGDIEHVRRGAWPLARLLVGTLST